VLTRAITTILNCVFLYIQNRPIPLVPNLQTLPPTWSGSRQEIPSEAPTSAGFHNDAFIGPHQPSIHLQQQLLHTQQSQQQQEDRNVLPKAYVHSADGVRCNAYFYTPTSAQPDLLSVRQPPGSIWRSPHSHHADPLLLLLSCFTQVYARQNTETVGELLVEFFRYFCWTFDMRHSVVSIRQPRGLSKVDKAEQDGWLQNDNLA
jgi:hypothetical protein